MKKRNLLHLVALAAVALSAAMSPGTADAAPVVYVAGDSNEFGTINLTTGAFTSIGTLNITTGNILFGMGFGSNGQLYGLDSQDGTGGAHLWQINTTTAGVTDLGAVGQTTIGAGSGLNGTMYSITYPTSPDLTSTLYTLNPPSTSTTVVGPTGLYLPSGMLAVSPGGDVFAEALNNSSNPTGNYDLFNLTTGKDIGPITDSSGNNYQVSAGLFVNGTLYGFVAPGFNSTGSPTPGEIITINTTTGAATFVTNYSLPNNDGIDAAATLSIGSIPEPPSVVLGLIALAAGGSVGLLRRRLPDRRVNRRSTAGAA
jgi:hypothetical protein